MRFDGQTRITSFRVKLSFQKKWDGQKPVKRLIRGSILISFSCFTGYYWIDARGGASSGRPIRVYCQGYSTCLPPDDREPTIFTSEATAHKFSQSDNGYRVNIIVFNCRSCRTIFIPFYDIRIISLLLFFLSAYIRTRGIWVHTAKILEITFNQS